MVYCKKCNDELTVIIYPNSFYFFCVKCNRGEELTHKEIETAFLRNYKEPMEEW